MTPSTWTLPTGTRCVLLVRVSTDAQAKDDRTSLAQQEHSVRTYAEQHFSPSQIFVRRDPGVSGLKKARVEEIVCACEQAKLPTKSPGWVVVYDRSRFSRLGSQEAAYYTERLRRAGWLLKSVTEPSTGEAAIDGPMAALLQEGHAALSRMLQLKIPKGLRDQAALGKFVGSRPPFGYRRDKTTGHLVIEEPAASTVQRIFKRYISGATLQTIAADLEADRKCLPPKALNREKARRYGWTPGTIRVILTNRAYRGVIIFKPRTLRDAQERPIGDPFVNRKGKDRESGVDYGPQYKEWQKLWQVVEGAHPPIIDEPTWKAAQRRITEEHKPRRWTKAKAPYWLSGLMTCTDCGGPVVGGGGNRHDGKGTRFYRCSAGNGYRGQCRDPLLSANAQRMHELVSAAIQDHVTMLLKTGALEKALDRALGTKQEENPMARLERERAKLRAEQTEIVRQMGRKVLTAEQARGALGDVEAQLAQVERKLAEAAVQPTKNDRARDKAAALKMAKDIPALLATAPTPLRRQLVTQWVQSITIDKHAQKVEVKLNGMPAAIGLTSSRW